MRTARKARVLLLICGTGFLASPVHAQWVPPIGIPAPSFGIMQTAPPAPNPWTSPVPGYYYVEQRAGATNINNPFGTPARPRITIPNPIPAGSVVELHGFYDIPQSSANALVAQGTAANPVFIRGASPLARPTIRRKWEVTGRYFILENLKFAPMPDQSMTGSLIVLPLATTDHIALRHSELSGSLYDGGLGIENSNGGASRTDNVVIWDNYFHDNGDVNASVDQDIEGIHVGSHASYIWVVDNHIERNSGNGIEIDATEAFKDKTHHIYLGRNRSHHNKKAGFWVKQATDVIFSQNTAYAHRPGNTSSGDCLGAQNAPDHVWWIYNIAFDCEYGIALRPDWEDGHITHQFFVGNVIYNIHSTQPGVNPDDDESPAAIMASGGWERHFVNNTFNDVDSGINIASPFGLAEVKNNIITNLSQGNGNHVNIANVEGAAMDHNLFFPIPRIKRNGTKELLTPAQMAEMKSIAKDPLFSNQAQGNFRIGLNSPAVGSGELSAVYNTFQQRYGISILVDADGRHRGTRIDMGAYSASAGPVSQEVVMDFGAQGLWIRYSSGQWVQLNALSPDAIATGDLDGDGKSEVIASFHGYGVFIWSNKSSWRRLHPSDAAAIATGDLDGDGRTDVLIDFPGSGIWVWGNNTNWTQLHPLSPISMITADMDGNGKADVIINFPGMGVWVWANDASWTQLHAFNVSAMAAGDFDGNGKADVILTFPGFGVWLWSNNTSWSNLHPFDGTAMAIGDADGDGKGDAFITFPGFGIWAWMNNASWVQVCGLDGREILAADTDGGGQSDVIIGFPGLGIWTRMNNSSWTQFSTQDPEAIATGDVDGI